MTNSKEYGNPFIDVSLKVTFTAPSGKTYDQWGFYKGSQTWGLRFMPNEMGVWSYSGSFSDGSGNISGSFNCVASTIPGPLKVYSKNARWFATADDTPIFLLGYYADAVFMTDPSWWKPYIDDWVLHLAKRRINSQDINSADQTVHPREIAEPLVNPRWVAYNGTEPVFLRSYYVGKLTHTSLDWSIKHVYQPLIDRGYNHIQYLGSLFGWMANKFEDAPDPVMTRGTGSGSKQNLDAWKLAESHFVWLNDRDIAVHHWTGLANAYAYRHGGIDWVLVLKVRQ